MISELSIGYLYDSCLSVSNFDLRIRRLSLPLYLEVGISFYFVS